MLQQIILGADFLVVVGLFSWLLFSHQGRKEELQLNAYLKLQKTLMEEHQAVLEQQVQMSRRLRHDLANHLETLESLQQSGRRAEYEKYEAQLRELYGVLKKDGLCLNYILDAMLVRKQKQCQESGITFDTSLYTVDGGSMDQTDLMIVFYELMEYGAEKAALGEEKIFSLEGNQENGYLFLQMTCPAEEKERKSGYQRALRAKLAQTVSVGKKYGGELHGERKDSLERVYFSAKL